LRIHYSTVSDNQVSNKPKVIFQDPTVTIGDKIHALEWSMKPLFDFVRNIFKTPVVWWPWMAGLPLINLSSVFFLPRTEAWVVLGTGLLAATIMTVLHAKLGYVRLVGIGHFVWIPMLIWLVFRLDRILEGTLFYGWLLTLIAMDTVSLLIDIVDLLRYLRGERTPRF
jgi:hypothetical protein